MLSWAVLAESPVLWWPPMPVCCVAPSEALMSLSATNARVLCDSQQGPDVSECHSFMVKELELVL